jgi:hypothetical protein
VTSLSQVLRSIVPTITIDMVDVLGRLLAIVEEPNKTMGS